MRFFLALFPGEVPPPGPGHPLLRLGFRVGTDGRLWQVPGLEACQGGGIVLDSSGPLPDPSELALLCRRRHFDRVLLNFSHPDPGALSGPLGASGARLLLHEQNWRPGLGAMALVSAAVTEGSFPRRLREAADRFGPENILLDMERLSHKFRPPDPAGQAFSLSELPKVGRCFSPELCCGYAVRRWEGQAEFLLFDDRTSMGQKAELAEALGIREALLFPREWPPGSG